MNTTTQAHKTMKGLVYAKIGERIAVAVVMAAYGRKGLET